MSTIQTIPREIEMLQQACQWLAECKNLDELKTLKDKAEALRLYYSKKEDGTAAENAAGEIVLRAARRIGEVSKQIEPKPGMRTDKPMDNMSTGSKKTTLATAGIAPKEANRCEAIAEIPEPEFEAAIAESAAKGKSTTLSAAEKEGRKRKRQAKQRQQTETAAESNGKQVKQTWEIRQGDCIEILSSLDSRSARLVFADPPYNIGVNYGKHYNDKRPADEFERWCATWMEQVNRVLKSDGSFWLLMGWEWAHDLRVIARDEGEFHLRQTIVWYESFGVNTTRMFNRCSRALLWFTKQPTNNFVFNDCPQIRRESDRQSKYNDSRANPDGKLWDDVWGVHEPIPRVVGTSKERLPDFPTQLPLALLRPIIACASNPGDLVIDPFSGSGTSGAACIELGRRFLGIELSEDFATLSRKRLLALSRTSMHETS